jgi:hypothetical protein
MEGDPDVGVSAAEIAADREEEEYRQFTAAENARVKALEVRARGSCFGGSRAAAPPPSQRPP